MENTLYKTVAINEGGASGEVRVKNTNIALELSPLNESLVTNPDATNPEQLFAMGYAASYTRTLQEIAVGKEINIEDFSVAAEVKVIEDEEAFIDWEVNLDVYIPNVTLEVGENLLNETYEACPYSAMIEGNMEVTLNLLLDE